ncbi:magnesium/cobalt transporter CorA [Peribacillus asahii]|uniref:magnesium/cobalt transporter CorA n=1 Tax=Peribacillus asahii TaxID=228899 RepID=UPI00382897AD
MIHICAITKNHEFVSNLSLEDVHEQHIDWYWVDFFQPNEEEQEELARFFQFHPLAIEDCLDDFIQRPKIDYYETYQFIILHVLKKADLRPVELDLFVGNRWLVTFHNEELEELTIVWERLKKDISMKKGPFFLMHGLIDYIVDEYYPTVYSIENQLNQIEDNTENETIAELIDQLFDLRSDLSKLRRTIMPMRDLLYRMTSSDRISYLQEQHSYFNDVYDHLLKLAEMLEAYRDFSSDIRDNYLSVNSNNMNKTMMTLTVITTIFMPLTFIAGVYGMNFSFMPELNWRYGYFVVLAMMGGIALLMFWYFVKKGWLSNSKQKRKRARKSKVL